MFKNGIKALKDKIKKARNGKMGDQLMKYEVKIDDQKYVVDAPNTYEAKVQASRQHAKKYPSNFASGRNVLAESKIVVIPVE